MKANKDIALEYNNNDDYHDYHLCKISTDINEK